MDEGYIPFNRINSSISPIVSFVIDLCTMSTYLVLSVQIGVAFRGVMLDKVIIVGGRFPIGGFYVQEALHARQF